MATDPSYVGADRNRAHRYDFTKSVQRSRVHALFMPHGHQAAAKSGEEPLRRLSSGRPRPEPAWLARLRAVTAKIGSAREARYDSLFLPLSRGADAAEAKCAAAEQLFQLAREELPFGGEL